MPSDPSRDHARTEEQQRRVALADQIELQLGPLRFPSAASSDQNRTCAFAERDGACILDDAGKRVWRGKCASDPEAIAIAIGRHGEEGTHVRIARGHSVDLKPSLSRAFSHDGPALIDANQSAQAGDAAQNHA
jgi:hypothetical protein